jgi:formyl-CoA transferase
MERRPLNGVRILDLTQYFAGPFCTMLLAGLGAEVIHIEPPGTGNPIRENPPFAGPQGVSMERKTSDDMSLIMLKRGRNKKSITLDLRTPQGKRIFLDLVRLSDVVVENFNYGVMERLGLHYEELVKVKPNIIYCSISGFGHFGPNRARRAYDIVAQAMSGFMDVTGFPDGPPTKAGIALGDAIPALFAAMGVISALYYKKETGLGQKVDVSMQDCLFALVYDEAFDVLKKLGLPTRVGNRFQRLAPYNCYPVKDGYIVLGVIGDDQFANLLRAIGREDLIGDPRYESRPRRVKRVDELDEIISAWTLTKTKEEAVRELLENRVPCGPVLGVDELVEDSHLCARKMVVELEHPSLGKLPGVKGPGFPIKLSECVTDFNKAAPSLGQHNEEIYGRLLGMEGAAIQKLREEKVI